jgi:hypothetical protein
MTARWNPPVEFSPREDKLCKRLKTTGRLFVFLRKVRHQLFDDATQEKLESIHASKPRGTEPKPAAMMVMVVLLQSYTRCSDDEAVRRAEMDGAWRMVLGVPDSDEPLFSKATLVEARKSLVANHLDEFILRHTIDFARESKLFDPAKLARLRIAIDSAPLEGLGRVEDTLNLLGSALWVLVSTLAVTLMVPVEQIVTEANLQLLSATSIKRGMDLDWSAPNAVDRGLEQMFREIQRVQAWIETNSQEWHFRDGLVLRAHEQLFRIVLQDVEIKEDGSPKIRQGVTPDRQISIEDEEMRHGRKTKSERIDGYKRYSSCSLDIGLKMAACVLPANVGEAHGADKMKPTLEQLGEVCEAHVDRAFLPSKLVEQVAQTGRVVCRPYMASAAAGRHGKHRFEIDLETKTVICPAGEKAAIRGQKAQFSLTTCQACPQRQQCQKEDAKQGRSVSLHPKEALLQTLKQRQATAEGRAELRERTMVEHGLAHLCNRQGPRARYMGVKKNDYDVRRHAAVDNLFWAERQFSVAV